MRHSLNPRIEIAGHRDSDTGETTIDVYLDGERLDDVLWHIFDVTTWPEDERDIEDRIPLSLWRSAAQQVADEGTASFAKMIFAYSTIDEKSHTVNDLCPAKNAQPDVSTVFDLHPATWYEAANASANAIAMSAAHGVVALRAFHASEAKTAAGKAEEMLAAYKEVTRYVSATLTELLIFLLHDLRQFAAAREIQVEAHLHHLDEIACALVALMGALQESATTVWARQLVHEGGASLQEALAEDVFTSIKQAAYRRYFEEIVRKP